MKDRKKSGLASQLVLALLMSTVSFHASIPMAYAQNVSQGKMQELNQAQLMALVAPIALYPDPLVSQILMASTYPLDIAEAYNWQKINSQLSGLELSQALQQQRWDPSVKSLISFPSVLGMMGMQLSWTHELGDAVLAQQSDVMNAIQELRVKAKEAGSLKSDAQQTVSTQGSGTNEVVVIQPTNPRVVYVPVYDPWLVYGGWVYPAYPPYAYYPPGYVPGTAFVTFGLGMAVGSALWGNVYWWGRGWGGHNTLIVNNTVYNNFNRYNSNQWSGGGRIGTSNWSPDMQRRNINLHGNPMTRGGENVRDTQREALRQNLMGGHNFKEGQRTGFNDALQMRGASHDVVRDQLRQNFRQSRSNAGARQSPDMSGGINGKGRSEVRQMGNGYPQPSHNGDNQSHFGSGRHN